MLFGSWKKGIAPRLCPIRRCYARKKQESHRCPYRPAVALASGHAPQRVRQRGRNRENQHQLKKIREWSRVFERMRAVGVEKTASVRAKLLDYFLRRDRT